MIGGGEGGFSNGVLGIARKSGIYLPFRRILDPVDVVGIDERRIDVSMAGHRLGFLCRRPRLERKRYSRVPQAVKSEAVLVYPSLLTHSFSDN